MTFNTLMFLAVLSGSSNETGADSLPRCPLKHLSFRAETTRPSRLPLPKRHCIVSSLPALRSRTRSSHTSRLPRSIFTHHEPLPFRQRQFTVSGLLRWTQRLSRRSTRSRIDHSITRSSYMSHHSTCYNDCFLRRKYTIYRSSTMP